MLFRSLKLRTTHGCEATGIRLKKEKVQTTSAMLYGTVGSDTTDAEQVCCKPAVLLANLMLDHEENFLNIVKIYFSDCPIEASPSYLGVISDYQFCHDLL